MSRQEEPAQHDDGTFSAVVAVPANQLAGSTYLTLDLPRGWAGDAPSVGGRYVLVRCGAASPFERAYSWQWYFRQPLFALDRRAPLPEDKTERWTWLLPHWLGDHTAHPWLLDRATGAVVNLMGAFGQPFALRPTTRNLLLLSDAARVPLLLPPINAHLDSGGRVSLLVRGGGTKRNRREQASLVAALPISVELQWTAPRPWRGAVERALPWADQLVVALPHADLLPLSQSIRTARFFLEEGFAQALVDADLACGVGACLACVIELPHGGYTRACVHGPVFDLTRLVPK